MAVGTTIIKTTGRLVFELERGEDKTTRSIEVPFPKTDTTGDAGVALQNAVDSINSALSVENFDLFIQPANWRDTNVTEEQWKTTKISYEVVTTTSTPIEPNNNQSNG